MYVLSVGQVKLIGANLGSCLVSDAVTGIDEGNGSVRGGTGKHMTS